MEAGVGRLRMRARTWAELGLGCASRVEKGH